MWTIVGNEWDVLLYVVYLLAWAFGGFLLGRYLRKIVDKWWR